MVAHAPSGGRGGQGPLLGPESVERGVEYGSLGHEVIYQGSEVGGH